MSTRQKYFAHPTAVIDEPAGIGEGTQIWHFSHIMKGVQIGKNCKLGQNVHIGSHVKIGNNVKIQNNVSVYTGVTLEDNVFCGPSAVFTNILTPRSAHPRNTEEYFLKTLVREGATIGANATIVCGITIGKNAFIGAGAVVTKDVSDYALVYGNPAIHQGWVCECGVKIQFTPEEIAKCQECGKEYVQKIEGKVKKIYPKKCHS